MVQVAIMGYGTIGSGVAKVLDMNKDLITRRAGYPIQVKYILDLREFPGDVNEDKIVHDFNTLIEDPEVQIVVETMGGTGAAYHFVKEALEAGKHVVTSNKALVAKYGPELMALAKEKNVSFLFEASVGGGIPIIRTLNNALTGDAFEEVTGILNGTTNFIMTEMSEKGAKYEDVLKEAQALGYAEADPTDDVEGYDAGRKIAILTSLISGKFVPFEKIHIEGISKITVEDMKYAHALHRNIKLLAMSKKEGDTYGCIVAPFMLDETHPLQSVNGVFNAVFVVGNALGDSMYYGSGAGSIPTASAVVGDIVDVAKNLDRNLPFIWTDQELKLYDFGQMENRFFVRVKNETGIDQIEKIFGNVEIIDELEGEYGFVTALMKESEMEEKLADLNGVITRIRWN